MVLSGIIRSQGTRVKVCQNRHILILYVFALMFSIR